MIARRPPAAVAPHETEPTAPRAPWAVRHPHKSGRSCPRAEGAEATLRLTIAMTLGGVAILAS